MPERASIIVPFEYTAKIREKGRREPAWVVFDAWTQVNIPILDGKQAPIAGRLRHRDGTETFRTFGGRLYRKTEDKRGPIRASSLQAPNAERMNDLQNAFPTFGTLPWKDLEKSSRSDHGNTIIAETFIDRRTDGEVRAATRASDLVSIDGFIYEPSPAPMIGVRSDGTTRPYIVTAEAMAASDPEINSYSLHYVSLFRIDRWHDACVFTDRLWQITAARHQVAEDKKPDLMEPPDFEFRPTKGYEHLFLADDLVASARWGIPFVCHYLDATIPDTKSVHALAPIGALDGDGLRAFATMRETTLSLERPEGATRANARKAYQAVRDLIAAEGGGWRPPEATQAARNTISHVALHLSERLDFDQTFAEQPHERLAEDDDAAVATISP